MGQMNITLVTGIDAYIAVSEHFGARNAAANLRAQIIVANIMSEKSLALIGNASGQDAEGARDCSEAFSIRSLEGSRRQWWALLWS